MAENNAYKLKLFQDETARGLARLYEAGYLPNDSMGEVSLRDAESGLVFISIKPGTFYIADPSEYHGSDIAVTTLDGEPVTTVTPPSERLALHLAVYKARPDVHAIPCGPPCSPSAASPFPTCWPSRLKPAPRWSA